MGNFKKGESKSLGNSTYTRGQGNVVKVTGPTRSTSTMTLHGANKLFNQGKT